MKKDDLRRLKHLGMLPLTLGAALAGACRAALVEIEKLTVDRDCYRRYWKEVVILRTKVERLEAKMHKTRDGVQIVPGMELWSPPSPLGPASLAGHASRERIAIKKVRINYASPSIAFYSTCKAAEEAQQLCDELNEHTT